MSRSLLRPGITGFAPSQGAPLAAAVELRMFKGDVYDVARVTGFRVIDVQPASVTPSFHSASLRSADRDVFVICNASCAIVAVVAQRPEPGKLRFQDDERLASAFEAKGRYVVARASDLAKRITSADLKHLDPVELKQVAYWRPGTVGEVIFNWFD